MDADAVSLLVVAVSGFVLVTGTVGAAVHVGLLKRKQAFLRDTQRALEAQRFTVTKVERVVPSNHATPTGAPVPELVLTAALVARDGRAEVHLSPTLRGAKAVVLVRGVKAAAQATFTVGRERLSDRVMRRAGLVDVEIGDPGFDARHRVQGWPKDTARAFVAAPKVKAAVEAMFGFDDVQDARLVAFREDGAVRVALATDTARLGALRPIADLAVACAEALDEVRFAGPMAAPASALPEGAAGREGGAPVGVPGLPPRR